MKKQMIKTKVVVLTMTSLLLVGCGGKETPTPTPEHEHSYTSEVTKEATCSEIGEKTYSCTCGDSNAFPCLAST